MRVENPANPGTPDVNVVVQGVERWIELKQVPELPQRSTTPVFTGCLKHEQIVWHLLRHRAQGRSWIIGYVEKEDLIYVISGEYAKEFNSMSRSRLEELTLVIEDLWKKP